MPVKERIADLMLVEEDSVETRLMLMAFRKSNPEKRVIWLRDGRSALEYLISESVAENFGPGKNRMLVMLNPNLPKMNGFELIQKVKKSANAALVDFVVVTGPKNGLDRALSRRLGVKACINKDIVFGNCMSMLCELDKDNLARGIINGMYEDEPAY
jgi:DNA-binding response OmpR family regulator